MRTKVWNINHPGAPGTILMFGEDLFILPEQGQYFVIESKNLKKDDSRRRAERFIARHTFTNGQSPFSLVEPGSQPEVQGRDQVVGLLQQAIADRDTILESQQRQLEEMQAQLAILLAAQQPQSTVLDEQPEPEAEPEEDPTEELEPELEGAAPRRGRPKKVSE